MYNTDNELIKAQLTEKDKKLLKKYIFIAHLFTYFIKKLNLSKIVL